LTWNEPTTFPGREPYPYNPGVPDRQLWAIGMVVAQWAFLETIMHNHVQNLIGSDAVLLAEYHKQQSFRQQRQFWAEQIGSKLAGRNEMQPLLDLVAEAGRLKSQRDRVMHSPWGGGMQEGTWSSGEHPTTDARLIQNLHPSGAPQWNLTYSRLRQLAKEIANLNVALVLATAM
jgi:hypothetical protein